MAQAAKTKPADGKPKRDTVQVIAVNTKVYHDYLIRDTVEAGLVLTGTEIKSIRAGKVNLPNPQAQAAAAPQPDPGAGPADAIEGPDAGARSVVYQP